MIDFQNTIELVAKIFYGQPNKDFTKNEIELRFGNFGSICVNIERGIWYDHEDKEGGLVLDLIIKNKDWKENPNNKKLASRWLAGKLKQHQSEFKPRLRRGDSFGEKLAAPEIRNKPVISGYINENGISYFNNKEIEAIYNYNDEKGNLLSQVIRYIKGPWPRFFQRRPAPDWKGDYWIPNIDGVRQIPYRLNEFINKSGTIFICEGEKDVDNLLELIRGPFLPETVAGPKGQLELDSIFATTNPGGCGKWKEEYNKYFTNFNCIILPDNDEPGHKHAECIRLNLEPITKSIKIIHLPELKPKQDVSDWIKSGGIFETLMELKEMEMGPNAPPHYTNN